MSFSAPFRCSQESRRRAVLEAAAELRGRRAPVGAEPQSLRPSSFAAACETHGVHIDVVGLAGAAGAPGSSPPEAGASGAWSLLQAGAASGLGPVSTRPLAQCKCEEYACTCSKACGCKLTGDGGSKLVHKLRPRMTAEEIMGGGEPRGQRPSNVDHTFRCGCEFDVAQSLAGAQPGAAGSGQGEEGFGLATKDGSLRCGCGKGACECRRLCKCSTAGAGASPSLLQTSSAGEEGQAADGWAGPPSSEAPLQEAGQPLQLTSRAQRRATGSSVRGGRAQLPLDASDARMAERKGKGRPREGPEEEDKEARALPPAQRDAGWDTGPGPGGAHGGSPHPAAPPPDLPPRSVKRPGKGGGAQSEVELFLPGVGAVA